ncbi:MBL fold metallo-hydrolase [Synergistales bacterium]|nr:MBL fold metallo-hydrolase [Synergistales bacterium]
MLVILTSDLDHSRAAADLMKQGIDVFASADTAKSRALTGHRLHTIEPFRSVRIDGFEVTPFDVQHDVPNLGFIISTASGERLLYATDTYYVKYVFPALTCIMLECNFDGETLKRNVNDGRVPPELAKRLYKSHMSLETVARTLSAWDLSKLRQVYLIHLSDDNSNEECMRRTIQALTGAEVYIWHGLSHIPNS